jgi:hypothetical protein
MSMEKGLSVLSAPRTRMMMKFERRVRGMAKFNL